MSEFWTVQRVKEELPSVQVQIEGKLFSGTLAGRKNDFATVFVRCSGSYAGSYWDFEVSWLTVVHCLNNDRPILM